MKIVLDPGHGPTDNVYPDGKHYEGYQMYYLGYYLFQALKSTGKYTMKSTRLSVTDNPTIQERGEKAEGADLFISLHSNACVTPSVDRVVVIPTITNIDTKFRNFCQTIGDSVKKEMGCQGNTQIFDRSYQDINDGIVKDYYGVLRNAVNVGCKNALILEHSFHTNPDMANWLSDFENLKELAGIEAKVIDTFLSGEGNSENYWGHYPTDLVTYKELYEILKKEKGLQ